MKNLSLFVSLILRSFYKLLCKTPRPSKEKEQNLFWNTFKIHKNIERKAICKFSTEAEIKKKIKAGDNYINIPEEIFVW